MGFTVLWLLNVAFYFKFSCAPIRFCDPGDSWVILGWSHSLVNISGHRTNATYIRSRGEAFEMGNGSDISQTSAFKLKYTV